MNHFAFDQSIFSYSIIDSIINLPGNTGVNVAFIGSYSEVDKRVFIVVFKYRVFKEDIFKQIFVFHKKASNLVIQVYAGTGIEKL